MDKIAFFVAVLAISLHVAITERHDRLKSKVEDHQTEQQQKDAEFNESAAEAEQLSSDTDVAPKEPNKTNAVNTEKIVWLSLEEAQAKMNENPKKLYVDVYTDWCGWCKVQDRKTFVHPEIIRLMNTYFYAVKFDAEGRDSVIFDGKDFGFMANMGRKGLNGWAHRYARNNGSLGYPTSLFFNEKLEREQVLATYLAPSQMEMILTYVGKDYARKGITWEAFTASFKGKIPPEEK